MRMTSLFTLAALGVATAGVYAQAPRGGTAGDNAFSDKTFVQKAAIGGMFEVKSSQLAQQMASSQQVKRFAARMITDHTKANQELMALARQKGWQVPTAMDRQHQDMLTQLRSGQGGGSGPDSDRFDRAYIDMQVKAHDKTVAIFEQAAQQCQDTDLKQWAAKTLPVLKEHQELASQMSNRGGATTQPSGTRTTTTPPGGRSGTVPPR
jgi:putative membrane protein